MTQIIHGQGIFTQRTVVLSDDNAYRYCLSAILAHGGSRICFVLLNPSTADHAMRDPTSDRYFRFASQWGYGFCDAVNLFAIRETRSERLCLYDDPVGPENDFWIEKMACRAGMVIVAWGNEGCLRDRDKHVLKLLRSVTKELYCLGVNQNGTPKFPLYVPGDVKPMLFTSDLRR